MKQLSFTFIFIFTLAANSAAQSESIKSRLSADEECNNQFLELGKCHVLDIVLKEQGYKYPDNRHSDLFSKHFFTLYDLFESLPRLFNKSAVYASVNKYYKENIDHTIALLKENDEKFKITYHSPLLIAELIFNDNEFTKALYDELISDDSAYTGDYLEEYLQGLFTLYKNFR